VQLTVLPSQQFAVALHDFGSAGRLAAKTASPCGKGQEPVAAG